MIRRNALDEGWVYMQITRGVADRDFKFPKDAKPTLIAFTQAKKLVDSVVNFQERSRQIIKEMRSMASRNSEEINEAVEDGKRRLAKLQVDAAALG